MDILRLTSKDYFNALNPDSASFPVAYDEIFFHTLPHDNTIPKALFV